MTKKRISYCSEEEACQLLGYKKHSLRILTRNEKRKRLPIRTAKINRKTILYSKDDTLDYINTQLSLKGNDLALIAYLLSELSNNIRDHSGMDHGYLH